MAFLLPSPTREACIEATTRIVCTAIATEKIPSLEAQEIGKYFAEVYSSVAQTAFGKS